jgi:MoaA/NifB/PqqE/SkfB family radical SAM enzyme
VGTASLTGETMNLKQVLSKKGRLPEGSRNSLPRTAANRPFKVAQVEITSRCFVGCTFCPQNVLPGRWVEGDLSLEQYRERIVPFLEDFELVYLQGWGEPMLHPNLWEMLALAKSKGCRTGFTTNGSLMREEACRSLLEAGVDMISISLSGGTPGTHQSMRKGSYWNLLLHHIETLVEMKHQGGYKLPWLELHFLMTASNLEELPEMVRLSASLGSDEVVATNLTYAPTQLLDSQRVFSDKPEAAFAAYVAEAQENARQLDIPLRVYPLSMEDEVLVCDANPLETVFINHTGEVTPCVYLGVSVSGEVPRYFQGQPLPYHPVSFGHICNDLSNVMNGMRRKEFTNAFRRRDMARSPLASFALLSAGEGGSGLPPAPEPCRGCYKLYGV